MIREDVKANGPKKDQWHPWFAWHPVTAVNVRTDKRYRVWLERIERRIESRFEDKPALKHYRLTHPQMDSMEHQARTKTTVSTSPPGCSYPFCETPECCGKPPRGRR